MITGKVIKDKLTKKLIHRIKAGQIALIAHDNLDRTTAQELKARNIEAVINVKPYITGEYPNQGPLILIKAGISLFYASERIWEQVKEGENLCIKRSLIFNEFGRVGKCKVITETELNKINYQAQQKYKKVREKFIENTLYYARREKKLFDQISPPPLDFDFQGQKILVVARGVDYKKDLAIIKNIYAEKEQTNKPPIIAVDGGADGCLELGWKPEIIIGDMDSVSREALNCGAKIIVHAYPDGRAPGYNRIKAFGLDPLIFSAPGTSEDIALLLAEKKGASIIAAVGTHFGVIDFLEKDRPGMGSTILTHMNIGDKLLDLRGINRIVSKSIKDL